MNTLIGMVAVLGTLAVFWGLLHLFGTIGLWVTGNKSLIKSADNRESAGAVVILIIIALLVISNLFNFIGWVIVDSLF